MTMQGEEFLFRQHGEETEHEEGETSSASLVLFVDAIVVVGEEELFRVARSLVPLADDEDVLLIFPTGEKVNGGVFCCKLLSLLLFFTGVTPAVAVVMFALEIVCFGGGVAACLMETLG